MSSAPEVVDLLSSSDDEEKAQKTTEMMMHHQNAGKNSTHGNVGRKSHCLAQKKTADECKSKRQRRTLNDYFGGISSDSSDDDSFVEKSQPTSNRTNTPKQAATHLVEKKRSSSTSIGGTATVAKKPRAHCNNKFAEAPRARKRPLQAGLVLEEDIFAANHKHLDQEDENAENCATRFIRQKHERIANGEPPLLFQDDDFGPEASAIDGIHKKSMFRSNNNKKPTPAAAAALHQNPWIQDDDYGDPTLVYPKCWCKRPAKLCFKRDGGKAYFACSGGSPDGTKSTRCRYFSWAFRSELMPWYRYGGHNQHVLVKSPAGNSVSADTLFSAHDLVQGKVGDCWFLSALAVVAERPDLIQRLFQQQESSSSTTINNAAVANWLHQDGQWGMVRVNLFLDGFWTQVILDNFLPCMLGQVDPKEEEEVKRAIEESLKPMNENASKDSSRIRNPYTKQASLGEGRRLADGKAIQTPTDSDCNPFALSEINLQIMQQTKRFLDKQRFKSVGRKSTLDLLDRPAESQDLAYSKARRNQLWVPFLEKAYAKVHGSYSAISGGHIAEAFLDLTGAPTLQIQWHQNGARHNSNIVEPRTLWSKLLQWRAKRLPMGCGTDSSAEGIIGMHAYSILDVREISNVGVEFFQEQMLTGSLGNVSGFTEYDGKVRLLRIRNPHGKGEWKGDFSDKSSKWTDLLLASGVSLPRTMANDGTFWIDYDNFLMGFSNIDVVLAFQGNHAKSFATNFPPKKSNHRCDRAFEVSLIDPQPGIETKDRVEVYVLGIQKNRRGSKQGRSDRKKSYKVSDMGMLVAEYPLNASPEDDAENLQFSMVHGQMFGFRRNGHYRLVLDRRKCTRMVVMPISFGHPAATDKEFSFAVRFNAEYPLMIRELSTVPRMDRVLSDFLFQPKTAAFYTETRQGQKRILWENPNFKIIQVDCLGNEGGTVFVYLCARRLEGDQSSCPIFFSLEARCRGMSCRTADGLLEHETIAKGEKFKAAWRKFTATYSSESTSRLLMVLYQSGQDTEMGSITCRMGAVLGSSEPKKSSHIRTLERYWSSGQQEDLSYQEKGIFHPVLPMNSDRFRSCGQSHAVDVWANLTVTHPFPADQETLQQHADWELEEALRRSTETFERNVEVVLMVGNDNRFREEDDLSRAIALSLKTAAAAEPKEAIDLTSGTERMAYGKRQMKTEDQEIVILDDSDGEEEEEKKKKHSFAMQHASSILERTCVKSGQRMKSRAHAQSNSDQGIDCKAAKRKLAAEAALKRQEKQKTPM